MEIEVCLTRVWNTMPKRHPDHQILETFLERINALLQPLHTESIWQKRLQFLAIQESILRGLVADGRITPTTTTASTAVMGTATTSPTHRSSPTSWTHDQIPIDSLILLTPTRRLVEEGYMCKVHKSTGGASAVVRVLLLNDALVYGYDHQVHDMDGLAVAGAGARPRLNGDVTKPRDSNAGADRLSIRVRPFRLLK
jgi:hypothetical protein